MSDYTRFCGNVSSQQPSLSTELRFLRGDMTSNLVLKPCHDTHSCHGLFLQGQRRWSEKPNAQEYVSFTATVVSISSLRSRLTYRCSGWHSYSHSRFPRSTVARRPPFLISVLSLCPDSLLSNVRIRTTNASFSTVRSFTFAVALPIKLRRECSRQRHFKKQSKSVLKPNQLHSTQLSYYGGGGGGGHVVHAGTAERSKII
jgi:hypothetical protein